MTILMRRFVQRDVRLAGGAVLPEVVTSFLTRGRLATDAGNCILVTHGYTGGPDMIMPGTEPVDGSWSALIGPGRPIDTDRYFVVCPNALGSSFGSTNASSIDPETGKPYGSRFPDVAISDIVSGQRALLDSLGVKHLVAAAGASFGGLQVLQWGVQYPDFMNCLVAAITAPKMPNVDVPQLQAQMSLLPGWNGGDCYAANDGGTGGRNTAASVMRDALTARRVGGLMAFGANEALLERFPDKALREAQIRHLAETWAAQFDPNSLLILFRTMAAFDITPSLSRIRAPLLYVLSRSDRLVPASSAPDTMAKFRAAGVDARYFEIDSDHGHSASGSDAHLWADVLRSFLEGEGGRR